MPKGWLRDPGYPMKALFVTVAAHELYVPINAWRNHMGPCGHITFNANGPGNDDAILACAKGYRPDVIFYIGANDGDGLPTVKTFQALREIAPSVHYQSDMEDETWHAMMHLYHDNECFDLCASQTGVPVNLVDYPTLIAIDQAPYRSLAPKTARCGFAGSLQTLEQYEEAKRDHGAEDPRSVVLHGLGKRVHLRKREPVGPYQGYVDFIRQCRIVLNVSLTGLGTHHHVKWRVLESAFARCVLLEMRESPTRNWFPADTFLTYGSIEEAREIIAATPNHRLDEIAAALSAYAGQHYSPEKIYRGILAKLGMA